jgi:hypothetical protein
MDGWNIYMYIYIFLIEKSFIFWNLFVWFLKILSDIVYNQVLEKESAQ